MATKIRDSQKIFHAPALPNPPAEYNMQWQSQHNAVLRYYFANVDGAVAQALQFDTSDIIDGSIPNSKLENSTVSFGGVTVSLGGSDATPAFNLSAATAYPAGSLTGEIATAQIADDAVTDAKLANSINAAISANSAKVTNATHSGEVTGATALTIADGAVVTARIADDAVTGAKIAHNTITSTNMNTASVSATAIQPSAVTTNKIADQNVTGAKIAAATIGSGNMASGAIYTGAIQDDAVTSAKITGPFSSKHAFSTNFSQSISTTAAVTVFTFSIPAPAGGVEATQSLSASIQVRFYNSSSSAVKENHQWKVLTQMKSKTIGGTSLGTATFVSSPSSYHAWYTVSGDKTSIICSNRGNFATTLTGGNSGSMIAVYYDAATDKTFFRVSKFPDATTVYNGVEVFYSPTAFVSAGTYVSNQGFNNQFLTIGSTTAYQTVELPLMATFGRSTTATDLRIQFDHVSSTTNLSTVVTGLYGHVENTV